MICRTNGRTKRRGWLISVLAAAVAMAFSAAGLLVWVLAQELRIAGPPPAAAPGAAAQLSPLRTATGAIRSEPPLASAAVAASATLSARVASTRSRQEIELPGWALEALGRAPGEAAGLRSNLQPLDPDRDLAPSDLAALAEIIRAAGLDESSSPFDYDDGDGVLEPWELGFQIWRDGELVLLSLGPSPRFSFGYGLETLAPSVGDLASLELLDLHDNALRELPASIGRLRSLRALRLDENRLDALPETLSDLYALRELNLRDNRLDELPGELAYQDRLERLAVGGNRLYCYGDPPPRLRDGSVPQVVGLIAQNCP